MVHSKRILCRVFYGVYKGYQARAVFYEVVYGVLQMVL